MNTLTIAFLVMCATVAYASALPVDEVNDIEALPEAAAPSELLEGAENNYGRGGYQRGGYYGGGYNGGGFSRGGGYYPGGSYYGGRGWGK